MINLKSILWLLPYPTNDNISGTNGPMLSLLADENF
jgi:hypothetical protein